MNDFTNQNGMTPPKAVAPDYNVLINSLRETLNTEPNLNRVNDILLKLVNEVRLNPFKEDLVLRELKDILYNTQITGNTADEQTKLCVRTMQNFIKQLDPQFITEDTSGRPVIQAPMKAKSNTFTALDREIEAAIADGDDEELEYLLKKKNDAIAEMASEAGINPNALEGVNKAKEVKSDTNYSLDGLNLSEEAINALNSELGVSINNNKPKEAETVTAVDWNIVKDEVKTEDKDEYVFPDEKKSEEIIKEAIPEPIQSKPVLVRTPEKSQKEIEREELLRRLAELDREEVPLKEEPKAEKAELVDWEEALKSARSNSVETVEPELIEVDYNEKSHDVVNVETAVVTSEEIASENKHEVIEEMASVKNVKHELMPVEEFDKYLPKVSKVPSESMLANIRGTRIQRIKAYAEAHKD